MESKSKKIKLDNPYLIEIETLKQRVDELENKINPLIKQLKKIDDSKINSTNSAPIMGEFIGVMNEKIVGWVLNQSNTRDCLNVSAYYQNKLIVSMVANEILTEIDLPPESYGHGFRIVLPTQFYDGKERLIRIKVDEFEYEIPFSPAKIILGDEYPLDGDFEGASDGYLTGWAMDHSEPFNTMEVTVFYNQRLVTTSIADIKRDDLENVLGTNIHHGFRIKLPNQYYDGRSRRFRLQISPWGCELNNSPQTISFQE